MSGTTDQPLTLATLREAIQPPATMAAMQEAVKNLREIFAADIKGLETRLAAIDKATELFTENLSRVPTDTDKQVGHLKELHDERFASVAKELVALSDGIAKQFAERDVRTDAAAIGTAKAVDAALQAQKEAAGSTNDANKEAIAKSEANTTKLIDGINTLLASNVKATDEKINDLKGRLDRGEGITRGGQEQRTEKRADTGTLLAIGALAVSVLVGAFAISRNAPPSSPTVVSPAVIPVQPK